jgi:ABC-2 type transport system permease protein
MRLLSPRLQAQIVKELLSALRDPKARILLIIPPLLQLLVLSFAGTLEVTNADLAIYNRDSGKAAFELIARVSSASFVGTIRVAHSPNEIRDMINRREISTALIIPESFSRELAQGRTARVQVLIDGRRANSGQVILGYLTTITNTLGAELTGPSGGMVEPGLVRHWFNPSLIYQWFVVPSIGGILLLFDILLITALSIARERELGTFDQLLVSPCTPLEIIVSKMAPSLIISSVMGTLMVGAGFFLFRIPFTGSFSMLFVSQFVFILSIVGIGLMISSVVSTQQQAILGTFSVAIPMILMSGFATPVENMPVVLQWLATAIPLKYHLVVLQGSFLKSLPPSVVFANVWPMAVIALFTLSGAVLFVRGKLE